MSKPYSKYSDSELFLELKRSRKEAESAFAELYSRHSQRIYAYCLRVTGNTEDANDIFQDAMLKFYDAAAKIDSLENVRGFLLRVARNLCLNFKRDKKTNLNIENFQPYSHDRGYEQKELLDLIAAALECLSFDYREAFVLRQYHGLSYREIANLTSESQAAIKNRVWRAKEKIKNILSPYLEDITK